MGCTTELLSCTEQVETKEMLQNLESESFIPSAFVSSKDQQVRDPEGGCTTEPLSCTEQL